MAIIKGCRRIVDGERLNAKDLDAGRVRTPTYLGLDELDGVGLVCCSKVIQYVDKKASGITHQG